MEFLLPPINPFRISITNETMRSARGLHALNAATEDAQLEDLLHQYFRLAKPTSAAGTTRGLKRPRLGTAEETETPPPTAATPEAALKRLKTFLKTSTDDKYMVRVVSTLRMQLQRAKRQRALLPLCLRLATELFARSAAFRSQIATQAAAFYATLLEAAGEKDVAARRQKVTGVAQSRQSEGVEMVLEVIESWKDDFGAKYPTLVAGHAWLVEVGYVFPCRQEVSERVAREVTERLQHQASVRELQVRKMEREMNVNVPEMETTIVEMDSIFEILVPTLEAFEVEQTVDEQVSTVPSDAVSNESRSRIDHDSDHDEKEGTVEWEDVPSQPASAQANDHGVGDGNQENRIDEEVDDDNVEWEDVENDDQKAAADVDFEEDADEIDADDDMDINDIVQAYGLGSSSYQLTISIPTTLCEKSTENEVLFRNLTDGVLQIRKRFLPLVSDWIQIADGDAVALDLPRDMVLLRQLHGLRRRLEAATLKWEDLVKESERKQFARVRPRVVSLPLTTFVKRPRPADTRSSMRPRRSLIKLP